MVNLFRPRMVVGRGGPVGGKPGFGQRLAADAGVPMGQKLSISEPSLVVKAGAWSWWQRATHVAAGFAVLHRPAMPNVFGCLLGGAAVNEPLQ